MRAGHDTARLAARRSAFHGGTVSAETKATEVTSPTGGDIVTADSFTADIATADSAALANLKVAGFFLVVSALLGMVAAFQIVAPDLLGGVAFLSYGRIAPVALDTFVYGWLTLGLVGAAYHVVPRVSGADLWNPGLAKAALGLTTLGVVAGGGAVLAGLSEGRLMLEYPLWADAIFVLGAGLAALVVTRTAAAGFNRLMPTQWFFIAAMWWLVLSFVTGNLPGIPGVNSELLTSFFIASLSGLWLVAAGVGVVYYVVPALTGLSQRRASRISLIAFWSLAFAWSWTGPRFNVYGPVPDWLETIGAFFAIGLLVPVIAIVADLAFAVRDRWDSISNHSAVRYVAAGVVFFILAVVQNIVQAFRAPSAVVQFTAWQSAFDLILFYGAISFWLFAFVSYALPALVGGSASATTERIHFAASLSGLLVAVGASWFGGLQQGLTWLGAANTDGVLPYGEQFINSVRPLEGPWLLRAFGLAIFALGQFLFLRPLFGSGSPAVLETSLAVESSETDPAVIDPAPPVILGGLLKGALGLFAVAALAVWVLPSFEPESVEGTILGDFSRFYEAGSDEAAGRQIYLQEGCWYCHTQQVRPIVTDVGLGPVSQPGDYVHETPAMFGIQRIGPDLMHAGSREPTDSVAWLTAYLENPRAVRSWSTMPSYGTLSDTEISQLAAYLVSLD